MINKLHLDDFWHQELSCSVFATDFPVCNKARDSENSQANEGCAHYGTPYEKRLFFFFFARILSLPQKVTYFGLFFDCFKHSWKQLCLDQNCKVFSSSAGKLMFSGTCWTILLLQREIKFATTVIAIPNLGTAGWHITKVHIHMTVYTVCVKAKASLGNEAYTTECSFKLHKTAGS